MSERNKRIATKNSPKSLSNWSLFTIQDASEDSGQSSGTETTEVNETVKENSGNSKAEVRAAQSESFHDSVAKLRHMQLAEGVHKELKQVLASKNKLVRKVFVEPKQSHLGRETKLASEELKPAGQRHLYSIGSHFFKTLLRHLLAREGVYAPGRPAFLAHAMQRVGYIVGLTAYG